MINKKFTVLLSASVPSNKRSEKYQEDYTKIKNAQIQIEEAVIGLSRNIFQAGGKIVFGGHPSISPLVAMVATEFPLNKEIENPKQIKAKEKPIQIFQSLAYENVFPKEQSGIFKLGYTNITLTNAVDDEKYDPNFQGRPQCDKSLKLMRSQMMEGKIDALVCLGGMEGVEREFEMFRELHPNKPVFLLGSTGGATKILATKFRDDANNLINIIDDIDYQYTISKKINNGDEYFHEMFNIIPYSYITSLIIQQILDNRN